MRGSMWRRRTNGSPGIGIVSNEFFDLELGRMGGFGWAARRSAETFARAPELGLRPVLLAGRGELRPTARELRSNGVPVLPYEESRRYRRLLRAASTSVVLTIDFRPNYLPVLDAVAQTPLVVWVRDPRTPDDDAKLATLRIPSSPATPPGVAPMDCTLLAPYVARASARGVGVLLAGTAPALAAAKVRGSYGVDVDDVPLLPNPLDLVAERPEPSGRPSVVFLGRLDPVKRPWLFVELARRFPQVDFLVLGQPHFTGEGSWEPRGLPGNVRILGHVDGEEKTRLLSSASALVNTAIHEGLAVSFLEALHCGTPIVSCQDPEGVVSRFGVYAGRWDGDGLDSLDAFGDALGRLLDDSDLRLRLGAEGRSWVRATHTREEFLSTFVRLTASLSQTAAA